MWLGSKDISNNTDPDDIVNDISEICNAIEMNSQAIVYIRHIDPRFYPEETPVSHERYKKIEGGINNRLKRRFTYKLIHFNTSQFVRELSSDGVQWSEAGSDSKNEAEKG